MLAVGCIQAQRCHTDHCPTGVATQNRWLTRGLDPEQQHGALAQPVFVPDFTELHQRSDQGVNAEGVQVFLRNISSLKRELVKKQIRKRIRTGDWYAA